MNQQCQACGMAPPVCEAPFFAPAAGKGGGGTSQISRKQPGDIITRRRCTGGLFRSKKLAGIALFNFAIIVVAGDLQEESTDEVHESSDKEERGFPKSGSSSKAVVQASVNASNHILLASMLEHLCSIYGRDPAERRKLFRGGQTLHCGNHWFTIPDAQNHW